MVTFAKTQLKTLWQGDAGLAPVLLGLLALVGYFQFRSSVFLTAGNLTNLFVQATIFILLGMAEVWLLLLGDIDLSLGYVMGLSAATSTILVDNQFHWPWPLAMATALLISTAIGFLHGTIVIRLRLPSFIVTLAGLLVWEGVMLWVIDSNGSGGTIALNEKIMYDLVSAQLTPLFTWIFVLVMVGLMGFFMVRTYRRRQAAGLVVRPFYLIVVKVVSLTIAGVLLVLVFNINRGPFTTVIRGMPFAIPIDFAVLGFGSFILSKTKPGRYLYAIGGNAEGARRAGVNVNRYRLMAFMLAGFTAGIAGLLYASRLGGVSSGIDGGTLVLYAVAAAVIGGCSLYGGRGKMIHAVIGGTIIATIYNGMALVGIATAEQYIVTGLVLLAAVSVDSLARRGSTTLH
jgi:D-xylose transport system permease protein